MSSTVTDPRTDRAFFGHPRGLANLFGVEVWERFSYYGMLASLTLYLYYEATGSNPGLGLPKATATSLVGAYGGLVYVSTIAGAWVADRVLGAERTLFYSAMLVMIGHIALAVLPGFVGLGVGLACVALGSGGVKGNATAVVGTLYAENDDRRDAGFSIFYMGINIGGLFGPLLTGLTRSTLGFHYAFGVAAIGMALGLIQYTLGRRNLGTEASIVPNPLPRSRWTIVAGVAGVAVAVVTNQSAVGRGLVSELDLARIHHYLGRLFTLDAIYHCPHLPEDSCICRKPLPQMVEAAVRDLGLDRRAGLPAVDAAQKEKRAEADRRRPHAVPRQSASAVGRSLHMARGPVRRARSERVWGRARAVACSDDVDRARYRASR